MHRQTTLFRADLFHKENIGTTEQRIELIKELKAASSNLEEIDMSNPGCQRIYKSCKNIEWLYKEIDQLLSSAIDFYQKEDTIFKSHSKERKKTYYWANINSPGSRNVFHSHKENTFSLVYYLQAGETGALRFVNSSNILGDCNPISPFSRDFEVHPKEGDLFLWPSWVPHEVETNQSNIERINLVFNITLH